MRVKIYIEKDIMRTLQKPMTKEQKNLLPSMTELNELIYSSSEEVLHEFRRWCCSNLPYSIIGHYSYPREGLTQEHLNKSIYAMAIAYANYAAWSNIHHLSGRIEDYYARRCFEYFHRHDTGFKREILNPDNLSNKFKINYEFIIKEEIKELKGIILKHIHKHNETNNDI